MSFHHFATALLRDRTTFCIRHCADVSVAVPRVSSVTPMQIREAGAQERPSFQGSKPSAAHPVVRKGERYGRNEGLPIHPAKT